MQRAWPSACFESVAIAVFVVVVVVAAAIVIVFCLLLSCVSKGGPGERQKTAGIANHEKICKLCKHMCRVQPIHPTISLPAGITVDRLKLKTVWIGLQGLLFLGQSYTAVQNNSFQYLFRRCCKFLLRLLPPSNAAAFLSCV